MDRRLVALALLIPGALLLGTRFAPAVVVAALLIPATSIVWAVREGMRPWAVAMAPGAVVVALGMPEGLPGYLCAALVGPLVCRALRRGLTPRVALAWGVVPFAIGAVLLAATGHQPFGPEMATTIDTIFGEAAEQGEVPVESLAELKASSEMALSIMARIWVVMEVIWFWASLVLGYVLVRRVFRGAELPRLGRFAGLDLPDAVVWVFMGGLALILLGESGTTSPLETVGWNLTVFAGFLFILRGIAIESHWLERGGLGAPARGFLLAGAMAFFLPLQLGLTTAIGLFDAWFDFRRIRSSSSRANPFGIFQREGPPKS